MIYFEDIVKYLKSGDASAHGIFMSDTISDHNIDRLLLEVNQALTDMYTRYPFKMKDLVLIQRRHIAYYKLNQEYAYTYSPRNDSWFIRDSELYPFTEDVLRILTVRDEAGDILVENSETKSHVINIPQHNVIEIPNVVDSNALFVVYRANHPKVSRGSVIELPDNFIPALVALVTYKLYSGGTSQEHVNKATMSWQKYELLCNQQRDIGMTNETFDMDLETKFRLGGWV